MAEFYDSNPIVVDNGTRIIKAGFAGDDAPFAVFPNVVAVEPGHANSNCRTRYIGDEAVTKKNLKWEYPMEHGVVADWDIMESVWHHMFYNELRVAPEEHTVLLTEPILNPKAIREKMTQILFETYNVRGMYVSLTPILSLYASGKNTGVVVDCGEGVTQVAPIEGGSIVYRAITRLKFSGSHITTEMGKLLNERGYAFSGSTVDLETVRTIKEKLAYVALDYENETGSVKSYELPDGQVITLETERYRCPEILFQPYLIENDDVGIHQATYESISNCNANLQKELYENIVLSGGSTMFSGIAERMTKEITNLAPRRTRVKVFAPLERKYSAWIGGSITASLCDFQEEWISKAEYDDHGPRIVHHKCV